ncbi:MAG: hypothetical protein JXN61_11060 [Sedimentisphaerales bacterium]|nr:hypothetical protein [Sedimentisphaerales bacterium]
MDAAQKKPLMVGIIIVCFGVAAFISFRGRGGGVEVAEVPEDATIWVKCVNLKCNGGNTVYEMNEREYLDFQREHLAEDTTPGMVCPKCGKPSVFEAMKCPKCGNVFISGEAGREGFSDRCPKCKYSQREEEEKMGSAQGAQGTQGTRQSGKRGGLDLE